MSKRRRRSKELDDREKIAKTVTKRLVILIAFLITILLVVIFRIGKVFWSAWMTAHQPQIVGFLALTVIVLILLSPVMVEASSNTKTLSGPGKNPKGPRLE